MHNGQNAISLYYINTITYGVKHEKTTYLLEMDIFNNVLVFINIIILIVSVVYVTYL